MQRALFLVSALCLTACGPSDRENNGIGVDASGDAPPPVITATVTGRVWAPNQAPGQAAPGLEIPISGALVWITSNKPEPIPSQVYCEQCVETPQGGVLSAADGSFTLDVEPGNYWLIIQKGQFRLEQQIGLSLGTTALPPNATTLPSQWKPEAGLFIPKIAFVQGTNDNIEDILGKIGFGTMSGNEYTSPMGENGPEVAMFDYGNVMTLLGNINEMRKYHIIFFPCSVNMSSIDSQLQDQSILQNIRRYVNEGGKLYVTDWSGEVADRPFPPQITLGGSGLDSTGTYDPVTLTGTLTSAGSANGGIYSSSDGKAVDPDLAAWLGTQMSPDATGLINPNAFTVKDNYNYIESVNPVMIGTDTQGLPVYDMPKVWVTGSKNTTLGPKPQAVTYQPTGCGKVLYTTFQTAFAGHVGLYPQERILIYLIMEIQSCSDGPIL